MSNLNADLRVALCQLTSIDDAKANLLQIAEFSRRARDSGAQLVCFPENALFMRMANHEPVQTFTLRSPELLHLRELAVNLKLNLHIGSVALEEADGLFNTSVLIRPGGELETSYKKIHLFDVDVEGHRPMRESDVFVHGKRPFVFEVNGWKFGASICYDLRFSELFQYYARQSVDVLLIPAAFLVPTGRAHWDILVRARAIESQAYVVAATQSGKHLGRSGSQHATFGHAMVVDPWGEIVAECAREGGPEQVIAVLSRERIQMVRKQIPMHLHRRLGGAIAGEPR